MSEVKQTIPGIELTSPCSCLVYWTWRGLAKIVNDGILSLPHLFWTTFVNIWLILLYPNILGLIVGFYITT